MSEDIFTVIDKLAGRDPRATEIKAYLTKLFDGIAMLRRSEAFLDEKLSRTPRYSGKWWYIVGQLNITRGQLIFLEDTRANL